MNRPNARYPEYLVEYEGPGFCTHSGHTTETDAYTTARAAREKAENGEGVGVVSWIHGGHHHDDVRAICVLRRNEESGDYLAHSVRWRKSNIRPDALTPRAVEVEAPPSNVPRPRTVTDFPLPDEQLAIDLDATA